jgi:hypothetical protein
MTVSRRQRLPFDANFPIVKTKPLVIFAGEPPSTRGLRRLKQWWFASVTADTF